MDHAADEDARRARSARFATMPIVLAGTIAVTAGLTGPVAHAETHHEDDSKHKRHVDQDRNVGDRPVFGTAVARPSQTTVTTVVATSKAPTTYTVRQGDTVSGIAARFGLSAQEVLVRNGLGWNTIIHPGQTLHLASTPAVRTASTASTSSTGSYHVKQGDTVSGIASRVGVSTTALLSANTLSSRSVIYPGQTLRVPTAGSSAAAAPVAGSSAGASSSGASSTARAASVKIGTGDTIASIAAAHGVSVSSLLSANGLSYTSTIYAGKTLVMPSAGGSGSGSGASSGTSLSAEQRGNAATIISVGRSLGVPDRGIVIALAAAMQESSLRNLPHGDRDSVGLFQQRPSQGWGSAAALQDPATATKLFFTGNAGTTRGLLDVPGWSSMSVTAAAQAVQVSAYPKAYAQWESTAKRLLTSL
ncbi:LysM peptidoglycan-binding domain-containing protein [Curtobacterium sp. MCPF17_002]|uniref:LysM peptidoglycan-binding domain-containing protein n=1 Tax=Curtobacterium sp. MCPF17_002 TaxID=2175645 RepID=UPI0021AD2C54|nr:LysM peptidoglycan-binding domain-containing protein [Curtobacterium sp. MCPF17_002]WIB78873.1 LysM peptidoglycan-binding domain-containing protein [Curtobacterium sp. MCPF17_002]